ncbi:MAG: hypothetical protein K9N23_00235 [Akkermansiaceae bacterium]|nr:hypothetical protein [Akkermansiaceae bacterium]MCF7730077.1 hypothetical protein [Akkermansiaceae bacterium]
MTRATIETDRRARVISWLAAGLLFAGGALTLWQLPHPVQGQLKAPEKTAGEREKKDERKKTRPLPAEYAKLMMKSSEVLVKRELKERLKRFEAMAQEAFDKEDVLLDQVDQRPVPEGLSSEINDTSMARGKAPADYPSLGDEPSVKDLYERIAVHEADIQQDHLATAAANKALKEGLSFPDTLRAMQLAATQMPGYGELIATVNAQHGIEGNSMEVASIDDINRYRDLLGQAGRQSGLAESRLLGMVGNAGRKPPPGAGMAGDGPQRPGNGGEAGYGAPGLTGQPYVPHEAKFESEEMVAAQALPGRRFSRETMRRGWLYVNTWYMIGPWESYGRNDFSITHPPEQGIDLDAVYHDGKTGRGIAENESSPLRVHGKKALLDGTLSWKFMQSESMHNTVPVTTDSSTCYAYTELYFDEPATMIVAIGTDDSGKLWINDREIWHDEGWSWYHIDEHIEAFNFRQGWNRIVVRIDNNGGAATGFSFLICPKDAALRAGQPKQ